jgi:hypothetical protein
MRPGNGRHWLTAATNAAGYCDFKELKTLKLGLRSACALDQELGQPWTVGYPPWSFVAGAALYGPPWPVTRHVSIVVSLLSLALNRLLGVPDRRWGRGGVALRRGRAESTEFNAPATSPELHHRNVDVLAASIPVK